MNSLLVIAAGLFTTVQDAGRPGHAHQGVAPSGYLDVPAATLANRLVGNDAGAALLETTYTGPTLRYEGTQVTTVALTGAPAPLRVGGRAAPLYAPVTVHPGDEIAVGTADAGLRSYLAISGGVAVPATLGSRSTDLLGGLGPPVLATDHRLPIGARCQPATVDVAPAPRVTSGATLDVVPGPRAEWLVPEAFDVLTGQAWKVSDQSNRIGVRLTGDAIGWVRRDELPSEGMVCGAIQIPPNGIR